MKCNTVWVASCALLLISNLNFATVVVQGNASKTSSNSTFLSNVLAKVYDHPTGTLIVATDSMGGYAGEFALAKAVRTSGTDYASFKGFAPSKFQSDIIDVLTLATYRGNTKPNIAFITQNPHYDLETIVNIISLDGQQYDSSKPLLDASGAVDTNGIPTMSIVNIAANQSFIFCAVEPNQYAKPDIFGEPGSGIAVVQITETTTPSPALTIQQVPAIPGDSGIKAFPLNNTTPQVLIEGDININPNHLPNNTIKAYPSMVWDDQLQRVYIGFDVETEQKKPTDGDCGGRSVVAAYLVDPPSSELALLPIAPSGAFVAGNDTNIIGVINVNACKHACTPPTCEEIPCYTDHSHEPYCVPEGCYQEPRCYYRCDNVDLSVHRLAVLHASTGPSYLIVNGGNGPRHVTGNQIYALPLVDVQDPLNVTQGTIANKASALTNGRFTVPATTNAMLPVDTDPAALVGAGPFPFNADNELSDMVVIGDTVYASSNIPQSSSNEVGIFYSQAMFDETGKIIRWTPWTKRVFPYNGFPNNSAQVSFFDVDASTGEVWAIDGLTQTIVCATEWDIGTSPVSLVSQINKNLGGSGCYSVLDLDQSTRGFNGNTCSRYALFGGMNSVIFAQISKAYNTPYCMFDPTQPYPAQKVMTDFSIPQNILVTPVPGCGSVTTLEYSRQTGIGAPNYFFAGTQNGLYVFAGPKGTPLNVTSFENLNIPPFINGSWQKISTIPGTVVDIKTTGNILYVLTLNTTPTAPLQGTVYSIPFQTSVSAMFAPGNIYTIAQTMTSPVFTSIPRFLSMQIISTHPDGSTEQLVLATNYGLFQSSKAGGVQTQPGTTQSNAGWMPIKSSGTSFYPGIGDMNTSIPVAAPSTVWPFNLQDPLGYKIYDKGSINQLCGSADAIPFNFAPKFFNSIETTNPAFAYLDPITYFWSDGARRFFIVKPENSKVCSMKPCKASIFQAFNAVMVLPFDTIDWNIANPQEQINPDPTLTTVQSFNWIQNIGASGITMAGTNRGVLGLE